jgi:hypothetical protein
MIMVAHLVAMTVTGSWGRGYPVSAIKVEAATKLVGETEPEQLSLRRPGES